MLRARVCVYEVFRNFEPPSHNIRPHTQCVITLNIALRNFIQSHIEAGAAVLKPAETHQLWFLRLAQGHTDSRGDET